MSATWVTMLDDYRSMGTLYHGTQKPEDVTKVGFCVPPAIKMIDVNATGFPDEGSVPGHLRADWRACLRGKVASPAFARWYRGRSIYDSRFDWPFLWRFVVWDWFRGLPEKAREVLVREARIPRNRSRGLLDVGLNPDYYMDVLGKYITLVWATDEESVAKRYGRGPLLKFNAMDVNAWGVFDDPAVTAIVFVCPTVCPQIPTDALELVPR